MRIRFSNLVLFRCLTLGCGVAIGAVVIILPAAWELFNGNHKEFIAIDFHKVFNPSVAGGILVQIRILGYVPLASGSGYGGSGSGTLVGT
jgi:hypothetical protein